MDAALLAPVVADRHVLEETLWMLRAARNRLDALVVRAARAADAVRWEAPSARAFDEAAEAVRRMLATADDAAAEGVADLQRALARTAGIG